MDKGRTSTEVEAVKKGKKLGLPQVQDGLRYLEKVRNHFAHKPEVYHNFLDVLKDFKSKTLDTHGVIKRVKELFKGENELILSFNQFLPVGYKIKVPKPPKPIESDPATTYAAKIKHWLKDDPEIYEEFLDILQGNRSKQAADEVYQRVQKIFESQPELLKEFKSFMPDKNGGPTPNPPKRVTKNKKKSKKLSECKVVARMENWECGRCTFSNPHSTVTCQMCEHSRHEKVPAKEQTEPSSDPDSWQCERCTFSNSLLAARCHLCGVPLRRKSQNKRNDPKAKDEDGVRDGVRKRRKRGQVGVPDPSIEGKKQKGFPKCTTKSCEVRAENGKKCAYHAKLVNFREQIRYAKKHLNKSVVATLIQKRDKFRIKGIKDRAYVDNEPDQDED